MRQALRLAQRGWGLVEPNPMVGAVLVRDGRVVARGYHARFGGAHAEVEAIRRCVEQGIEPRGCELYVTLEPCAHYGKTPPCVELIIQSKIKRVTVAMEDPNPLVSGRGVAALRGAGVAVRVGVCAGEAARLNEPFVKRVTTGLPWVIAKWAQTLDGRIATRCGDSRWISNARSRRLVHRWRSGVDAILVGIGTVLADDPQLTARGVAIKRLARRVVIDPRLRIPLDARLLAAAGDGAAGSVTVAVGEGLCQTRSDKLVALEDRGVEVIGLTTGGGKATGEARLSFEPLLRHLAGVHGATNVLVEGGAKVMGAFFEQGLVDQARVFVAPRLLADSSAVSAAAGSVVDTISAAQPLRLIKTRRIDDDVLLDYRVGTRAGEPG